MKDFILVLLDIYTLRNIFLTIIYKFTKKIIFIPCQILYSAIEQINLIITGVIV